MKDFALIVNPTAAGGKRSNQTKLDLIRKTLDNENVEYDIFTTEYYQHAIEIAEELAKDGYSIIGVGGDGTCNEVLNGVIKSRTQALLGFIPIGTGNDIPGAIGYHPRNIKRACEVIAEGYSAPADVGVAQHPEHGKRYFLGIGSQGFDAEVTKRTNEGSKRLPGTWNYIASVIRTVFGFKRRKVRVIMDEETWEGQCNLVAVGNGPTYGGWMYICPRAMVDDGKFTISIVNMNSFELLYKFNKMYPRTLHPDTHITEFESQKVVIEMMEDTDEPYISQVDGEIIGNLPIEYQTLQDGYEFIQPRKNEAETWFFEKYGKKFNKYLQKLQRKGSEYWKGRYY